MVAPKIFISYAREDEESARNIFSILQREGCEPWVDIECLLPGENWKLAIQSAIKDSDFFLALLSENSINKKGYFQKELKSGISVLEEIPESGIYFIPARLESCKPNSTILGDIHWVDLFPSFDKGVNSILSSIFQNAYKSDGHYAVKSKLYTLCHLHKGGMATIANILSESKVLITSINSHEVGDMVEYFWDIEHSASFDYSEIGNHLGCQKNVATAIFVKE